MSTAQPQFPAPASPAVTYPLPTTGNSVVMEMLVAQELGIDIIVDPALLEDPDYIAGDVLLCNDDEVQ